MVKRERELTKEDYMVMMSPEELACRGRHSWPKLIPGRPLPDGYEAQVEDGKAGVFLLTIYCRDCGLEADMLTLPKGRLNTKARWRLRYDKEHHTTVPRSVGLTPTDCREFAYDQQLSLIQAIAGKTK